MSILQLKGVSKSYGPRGAAPILRDVSLDVAEGEFVAIVGYSGSGKTTLINLMAGLVAPDQGEIRVRGEAVAGPGPDRAVVFQNYSLLPWLSVLGNVLLAVDNVFPSWPAAKRREHAERHIALVNLSHARDRKPRELSGGMRQRVSLARALAMDPRILLMDEPLGALDALTRATLQDELGRICREQGKTVVLITNDPDEGIYLADRIIPLSAGPAARLGDPVPIPIPCPRDRKTLNQNPLFKTIRKQIIDYLLGPGGRPRSELTRQLTLPDLEPEDLTLGRPLLGGLGRGPRRRGEERRETVEVA
jgi:nitrate/nitrite transport system ATP-binding protein